MTIHSYITKALGLKEQQVKNVLQLFEEGATIPFISRYRKERTQNLDEVEILNIQKKQEEFLSIEKRKKTILSNIQEQGKLNDVLKDKIDNSFSLSELEDIYLPYKQKRKTKGLIAKENGLEPLAKIIMAQNASSIKSVAQKFLSSKIDSIEKAIEGAMDIIAEWINESIPIRNNLRQLFQREAILTTKATKKENDKYQAYVDWSENINKVPSHRFLAIYRADKEGVLKLHTLPDEERALKIINNKIIKNNVSETEEIVTASKNAYKRLLRPSIETELIHQAKKKADQEAIKVFSENLRQLLLSAPLGNKRILAIDPGYRTGCKVVCLDEKGDLLSNTTIYPHKPQEERKMAAKRITSLVEQYKIEAIAIGNGTAGRETEYFVRNLRFNRELKIFVVSEDGASIYSASAVGRKEFPDYDVTVRGAVSIGRRLMDPLAELVKIDPKSLGIGQYQHEVDQSDLKESLDFVVSSVVNQVGVNLNTASEYLLQYVSGLGLSTAQKIVAYRKENGLFKSRKELLKVSGIGAKMFEQAAGFLRIPNAENPLDNSAVHPESYAVVEKMAKDLAVQLTDLIANEALIKQIDLEKYVTEKVGLLTIEDIVKELRKKGVDPRQAVKVLEFDASLRTIEDVKEGMIVPGIVTNITNFGAFVDIGIKENGLIHISKMANEYVSNPQKYVKLHQHLQVQIISVDVNRKRIQLSLQNV